MQINRKQLNNTNIWIFLLFIMVFFACQDSTSAEQQTQVKPDTTLLVGAERLPLYLPRLANKNVGLVVNQTSLVGNTHLVDTLLQLNVKVTKLFAPEHGFRGEAENGAHIDNDKDPKTGIPILSLHGKTKKPTTEMLSDLDIVLYDIQDVGARFYTYLSTMHLVMEACAERNIPVIILDRPNPNGHYVDGPVMEDKYKTFLGKHNIPIVHGMTLGELSLMINKEGWLTDSLICDLEVISIANWDHTKSYSLSIKPSANLPNDKAINLYPSLCLFEQTVVSVGRGTEVPFTILGHPNYQDTSFCFTPSSRMASKYPKHEDKKCYGMDLSNLPRLNELNLQLLLDWYLLLKDEETPFFYKHFRNLAGTEKLQNQIEAGWTSEQIKATWQSDLIQFKKLRKQYLLYKDFE